MRKGLIIAYCLAAIMFCGCKEQGEVTEVVPAPVPEPVPELPYVIADLALAVPDISSATATAAATRMTAEIVQDGSARPVQMLSITPFAKKGVIERSDLPSYDDATGFSYYEFSDKTVNGNAAKFHYFEKFTFMPGVASFLTYGKAKPVDQDNDAAQKAYNGSLILKADGTPVERFPNPLYPGSLSFELEPIYDIDNKPAEEKIPAEAQQIADYLTSIGNSKVDYTEKNADNEDVPKTLRWSDTEGVLLGLFNNFISLGNDLRPGVLAGSSANVIPYVNALYEDLAKLNLADHQAELCEKIKENILAGAGLPASGFTKDGTKVTNLGVVYPGPLGLPDGAAVLQWDTETRAFAVITQTSNTSNITGISRYAYPAELYYYGNSRINTSNSTVLVDDYGNEGKTTWEDILSLYEFPLGEVGRNTKALAIRDALQYGVAKLQAKVNPVPSVMKDSKGENVPVGANSFPITGIIVSGQNPVGFDFKVPDATTLPETSVELFVYDHQIRSGSDNICLSSSKETPAFSTLVLQSKDYDAENPDKSDITVILEFENNSGQDFCGENKMVVFKGTKFYLIGKLKVKSAENDGSVDDDTKKRVFTQDHTTEVTMTINSLARAYNVMPNILSGRLELSVEMKLKWVEATPTTVILK